MEMNMCLLVIPEKKIDVLLSKLLTGESDTCLTSLDVLDAIMPVMTIKLSLKKFTSGQESLG